MEGFAIVGGRVFDDPVDHTADLTALDGRGWWVVVIPFSGAPRCVRFASVRSTPPPSARSWHGPDRKSWTSSMDPDAYVKAVSTIRDAIAAGDVYEVNLCRQLSTPWPAGADVAGLGAVLRRRHPALHGATVVLPDLDLFVASASPELFLCRCGELVRSRPIKGTARSRMGFTAKDRAENVMIVDLVRNDLGRVCEYGSIAVPGLCEEEAHPGLVHLVSTVEGRLRPGVGWPELVGATFPPGSVTGAPKLAALEIIEALEPVSRNVYCGAIGWVDADGRRGQLNVAIRTFWAEDGRLRYGTGGAITWDSTAGDEWAETELKADRALSVASGDDRGAGRLLRPRRAG